MAEEMAFEVRRAADRLYWKKESTLLRDTVQTPVIIAVKGDLAMGRNLVAFCIASILRCPLIKEQDFDTRGEKADENQEKVREYMCNLARSQLRSGPRSVVIDSELADPKEFFRLKELSEITNTRLAIFEFRMKDLSKLWNSHGVCSTMLPVALIATEFMEKPTSLSLSRQNNMNFINYSTGNVPRILIEISSFWNFQSSVFGALEDLRAHIDPDLESEQVASCKHRFKFVNIADGHKRRCCECRQLVSGSVYNCIECRFFVHRTCSYFRQSLKVANGKSSDMLNLYLRHAEPEIKADASCSCCKQLIRGGTEYYSIDDGKCFLDLDCLFLLPAFYRTKLHEHELKRSTQPDPNRRCNECWAIIDQGTIFYYCSTCDVSIDVYCLWLPETVVFEHHRHPFKLSIVPSEDTDPYYCDVCEKERDTERWVYYCQGCDFPIHPRCIVEKPCVSTFLSEEMSKAIKNSKEKLDDTFHSCSSSHSPTVGIMRKELHPQIPEAKELHLLFRESIKEIKHPIIISTKGKSYTGRKLVASTLAAVLDCFLIDEDNLYEVKIIPNKTKEVWYEIFSRIALSQLQIGFSVVIDCELLLESEFLILRDLAKATKTPFFVIECKPSDEFALWRNTYPNLSSEEYRSVKAERSNYEYDVGDTPKLLANITAPTFEAINKCMPNILHSILAYTKLNSMEFAIDSCSIHHLFLGSDYGYSESEICKRCLKHLSRSTHKIRCTGCRVILHRTCSNLPLQIIVDELKFILKEYGDENDKERCSCCKEIVKGYAYNCIDDDLLFDLDCFFTPSTPGVNLHSHSLCLCIRKDDFICDACGFICRQKLYYTCISDCLFDIGVNCGWLQETMKFERHPFQLAVSPEHDSNQYYCDVCEKERDQKHWIYYCAPCDFPIHINCLVPTGGCCSLESPSGTTITTSAPTFDPSP